MEKSGKLDPILIMQRLFIAEEIIARLELSNYKTTIPYKLSKLEFHDMSKFYKFPSLVS
jgi:hypothetical protein